MTPKEENERRIVLLKQAVKLLDEYKDISLIPSIVRIKEKIKELKKCLNF